VSVPLGPLFKFFWVIITHTHPFNGPLSGTTWVSRYQKGKTNLDFTEARDSGISWAICKSAPRSRQITMPATQWCIAKNGGGYTQRGVAKGLKVPCLFMITEVSIRCPKKPGGWYTAYTPQYTTAATHYSRSFTGRMPFLPPYQQRQSTEGLSDNYVYNFNSFLAIFVNENQDFCVGWNTCSRSVSC